MASRMATYFVPGAGIDREVITTDICRYLGPDALVKPGVYTVWDDPMWLPDQYLTTTIRTQSVGLLLNPSPGTL